MAASAPSHRVAVPLAAALLGFLVVLAASQREAPARSGRRLELVDLIREQDGRISSETPTASPPAGGSGLMGAP